jgi:signal transduction histidine kinase
MALAVRRRIERDARFAGDVSHELRSPLTTLAAAIAVLHGRRAELSTRNQDALQLAESELARFEQLVEDLLEISRGDTQDGVVDAEPVRVSELILNLLDRDQYQGITARFDSAALDAVVLGDKRRLEQVFRNILDNAARYAGGATAISAHLDHADVVVFVDDQGPGIEVAERERIFDRFARARSSRRAGQAGSGLGLALVRQHVGAHNGSVWATEAPGGGARFVIRLPRSQP